MIHKILIQGGVDPIAGGIFTTRRNVITRILSISSIITTSAVAGNRLFGILVSSSSGSSGDLGFWPTFTTIPASASLTTLWMMMFVNVGGIGTGGYFTSTIPDHRLIPDANCRIVNIGASDAGDRIGTSTWVVEETTELVTLAAKGE